MRSDAEPLPPCRILIVDDADEARSILAIAMGTIPGACVRVAEGAESALRQLTAEAVDVLLTDVSMSGMDGFELLRTLRDRGQWPLHGAVVITGEPDPDLPRRASESGAAAFFKKPF